MKAIKCLFLLFFIIIGMFPLFAQDVEVDCATILVNYQMLIEDGAGSLGDLATLQSWRRNLESADPSPCVQDGYKALLSAINLTGVAIVLNLTEKADEAENLFAQAAEQAAIARTKILNPDLDVAIITVPEDGETVAATITVEGTYKPDALGKNQLMVFVRAPDGNWYPQAFNGCDEANSSSVHYDDLFGTWDVQANLGTAPSVKGQPFALVLMLASPEATQAILSQYPNWCQNGSDGLSQQEVDDLGMTRISAIRVTHE
jgi:hypothetical protein